MKKILCFVSSITLGIVFTLNFASAQNAVSDSSFEGGTPSSDWIEFSTHFGTPLCELATCQNCSGPCVFHTGSWFLWFGGTVQDEIGFVKQTVTVPVSADTTYLSFWFGIPTAKGSGTDSLAVIIDDSISIFLATDSDSALYATGYTKLSFNAEAYEGGTHTLEIWSHTLGTKVTNFLVDDVWFGTQELVFNSVPESEHLTVFPTPAHDDLNIDLQLKNKQDLRIELLDLKGSLVFTKNLNQFQSGNITLDVRNFPAGTYFLTVNKSDGPMTTKITIR